MLGATKRRPPPHNAMQPNSCLRGVVALIFDWIFRLYTAKKIDVGESLYAHSIFNKKFLP